MVYEKYISDLRSFLFSRDERHFAAKQLLELHKEAASRDAATILELGVDRGQSTKVFLNAIEPKAASRLFSVDIRDCSSAARSNKWTFIQSDSADIDNVLKSAPELREGIDVLYVDSMHDVRHVYKEVSGYYPFLNKNSVMFFDDIDSFPYMLGQRKENVKYEIANRKINALVEQIFEANSTDLDLTVFRGSTGLARLDKRAEKGSRLIPPEKPIKRNTALWLQWNKLMGRKSYRHDSTGPGSFLIDPTKYD